MGTWRFWERPTGAAAPREPTPYCDRLTLADAWSADDETRAKAEDLRAERMRVIEAATSSIQPRPRQ